MVKQPKLTTKLNDLVKDYRKAARGSMRSLSDGWREYAAVGASMGLVSSAEAQIVHVVPDSPLQFTVSSSSATGFFSDGTEIDLNGDGVNDVTVGAVRVNSTSGDGAFAFTRRLLNVGAIGGLGLVAASESAFGFQVATSTAIPLALDSGQTIDGNAFFGTGTFASALFSDTSVSDPVGTLTEAQDLLFGFAVNGGDGDQFGWIRIALEADDSNRLETVEVLEWAFQTDPGVAIAAGDTGLTPGDFDGDGDVDADDYQVWLDQFGDTVAPGTGADGNGDGVVNTADYAVFRDNLTPLAISAAVAVPEPTTVSLGALALGAAGVTALRRRRQS